jgi:Uma2 family endonuclease
MLRHDEMDSGTATPIPMSYEDWLAWSSESRQSEWEDGHALPFPPPTLTHARARHVVVLALGLFVEQGRFGLLLMAPVEMRLPRSAREPDILFVAAANRSRLTEVRLVGPADLVVEIVSDDSVGRDRVRKFAEYAENGVREHWIGDPRPGRGVLEGFALGAGGYESIPPDPAGWIPSRVVPGFRFDPTWFNGDEPDVLAALRAVLPERFGAP